MILLQILIIISMKLIFFYFKLKSVFHYVSSTKNYKIIKKLLYALSQAAVLVCQYITLNSYICYSHNGRWYSLCVSKFFHLPYLRFLNHLSFLGYQIEIMNDDEIKKYKKKKLSNNESLSLTLINIIEKKLFSL